jgi:hypothetical protein
LTVEPRWERRPSLASLVRASKKSSGADAALTLRTYVAGLVGIGVRAANQPAADAACTPCLTPLVPFCAPLMTHVKTTLTR